MSADYGFGMQPDGRQCLIIVIKGTFLFPEKDGAPLRLASEQEPLCRTDSFEGEPGKSPPLYENDFALYKPWCDVLLRGTGYAPDGRPATLVPVALKVGPLVKRFNVVGDRTWQKRAFILGTSEPRPFITLPITYARAFGGEDSSHPEPAKHRTYLANPVGVGMHINASASIDGARLPNTEEMDRPIRRPDDEYIPMAFGPLGRSWLPRIRYAGTYDQSWLDEVFPFLPADFQDAYYQAAPSDQQLAHPVGAEEVVLLHLTPQGRTSFRLPEVSVPVTFIRKRLSSVETEAVLDTIYIEPDVQRVRMCWRTFLPLQRDLFEMSQVFVGEPPRGLKRARERMKPYYASLGALARGQRMRGDRA
jgi:hypothetical protein